MYLTWPETTKTSAFHDNAYLFDMYGLGGLVEELKIEEINLLFDISIICCFGLLSCK